VLSGNRNFEARIHPNLRANFLASPPLVVAYALAGSVTIDLMTEPVGKDAKGRDVYLGDIWPSTDEVSALMQYAMDAKTFKRLYSDLTKDHKLWNAVPTAAGQVYDWPKSTYIAEPPFFDGFALQPAHADHSVRGARALGLFGDSITTDHISPAGSIKEASPAGQYLVSHGVERADFNSYGARRGNHEVMMRGTFANTRIKNQMVPGIEGGVTTFLPGDEVMPIYDAAMKYQAAGVPLIILAGKEYGSGSSRDWAAKGTMLLGVKVVIAESFERIHRSNLVNMGVLPLQFVEGQNPAGLGLTGRELFAIEGAGAALTPRSTVTVSATAEDGSVKTFTAAVRIDTPEELTAFSHGGILPYVLRQLVKKG
jgi:aconitate hydratase